MAVVRLRRCDLPQWPRRGQWATRLERLSHTRATLPRGFGVATPRKAEFVGTSIASGGNGVDFPANGSVVLAENPHIKFVNALRGYVVCDLDRHRWRTEYRTVPFVTTPGAPVSTRAAFEVLDDVGGVHPA